MVDKSSPNDQYDFASFGMLSLLFGHPFIIHFVTFFSPGSFIVSSLITSDLDFLARAFHTPYVLGLSILLVCHLLSLPGVHMTRYLPRSFPSQPDKPSHYHTSVNWVTFSAIVKGYSVVVSSLLLLVFCDHSVLSLSFHISTGEIFDIQISLLTSSAQLVHIFVALLSETLMCMQLVCHPVSRIAPIPDLLASIWIWTGFCTS